MEFNEKDVKKFTMLFVIACLGVLAFLVIRPVVTSVIAALILAYLFMPLNRKIVQFVRNKTFAASIVLVLLLIVIILPAWFLTPVVAEQVFAIFRYTQTLDVQELLATLFPTASTQFAAQAGVALTSFISKVSATVLNALVSVLLDVPTISLHLFIVCFVFFFALRDHEPLANFVSALSPFAPSKEKVFVKHFRDITDAVIYGQIVIGLVQGALAGLGFVMFGINNALVLTLLATLLSITPIIGPFIIWVPISIYLFATAPPSIAIGYFLYNLIIVSTIDNVLRSYLVSRRTNLSPAVIFVGMVGGIFIFGIMGLILGPLILAYFLIFLQSYKERTLYSLFSDKEKVSGDNAT